MTKIFTPHEHQKVAIAHLQKYKRAAVWLPMGFGKSVSVLTALENLKLIDDVYPVLIIAPLRVARTTWPDEIKKWVHTQHLKISCILGKVKERAEALKTKADIHTINAENVPWLIEKLAGQWPYRTIVFDEASRLSGFRLRQGTKRAQALSKVAFKSKYFFELTGTPSANSLAQLWGQLFFLDQGERLGKTFTAFRDRWFRQSFDGFSIDPLPNAQKEIEEKIRDICLSIRAEDYYPLEKPIVIPVPVKLPPMALRQYKDLEKKMFVELGKHKIEPLNAAAKTNKCHQFANGAVYVGEAAEKWEEVHNEKLEALGSIIEEAGGTPILVAFNFRSDLVRLQRAFPKAKLLDKDPKTIADWNAGKIPLLLAHPKSAGHGLDLQHSSNILVYFSLTWNLEEFAQILERIGPARQKQAGYNRPVFVYYILAEGTIDYLILERLETKKTVQQILIDAMAKRDVKA